MKCNDASVAFMYQVSVAVLRQRRDDSVAKWQRRGSLAASSQSHRSNTTTCRLAVDPLPVVTRRRTPSPNPDTGAEKKSSIALSPAARASAKAAIPLLTAAVPVAHTRRGDARRAEEARVRHSRTNVPESVTDCKQYLSD